MTMRTVDFPREPAVDPAAIHRDGKTLFDQIQGSPSHSVDKRIQLEAYTALCTTVALAATQAPPLHSPIPSVPATHQIAPAPQSIEEEFPLDVRKELIETLNSETAQKFSPDGYPLFASLMDTLVQIDGKSLPANFVGSGVSSRIFVASQLPPESPLFWKFISSDTYSIIDLTDSDHYYVPTTVSMSRLFGTIAVRLRTTLEESSEEASFTYEVYDYATATKHITQRCHYKTWKAYAAIPLQELKRLVSKLEEKPFQGPILIHCNAGMGRTGTLITACIIKELILQRRITRQNIRGALIDLIIRLREQRGVHFVESTEQFNLLLDFAIDLLKNPPQS